MFKIELTKYDATSQNHSTHITSVSLRYCPGTDNPDDLPSQGVKASILGIDPMWREGPDWLELPEQAWPPIANVKEPPIEALEEMKADPRKYLETSVNVTTSKTQALECLIRLQRFSSAQRLFRITAYVLRFIRNTRARKIGQEKKVGPLSTEKVLDS